MLFFSLFNSSEKKEIQPSKEQALDMIQEITEQLAQAEKSLGKMGERVGPSIKKCIYELGACRRELNMLLNARDSRAQDEFYRRVIQLLSDVSDKVKKMNYFYAYIDSVILPKILELSRLLDENGKIVN